MTTVIKAQEIKSLLEHQQHHAWCQLNANLITQICQQFAVWSTEFVLDKALKGHLSIQKAEHLVEFLHYAIQEQRTQIFNETQRYTEYKQSYSRASSQKEKQQHILKYSKALGANKKQLVADKQAFQRWFGHDAISERYQHHHLKAERYLSFLLDSLGRISAFAIEQEELELGYELLWKRLDIEPLLKNLLVYKGDQRVLASAFKALTLALAKMPVDLQESSISPTSLRFIYHASLQSGQSVWVQCEALQLLKSASPESFNIALRKRLEHPSIYDGDLFVRRKVVQLLGEQLPIDPSLMALFPMALKDSSPSVRQKIPNALLSADKQTIEETLPPLLFNDAIEQVRASALLSLIGLLKKHDCFNLALGYLDHSLKNESAKFVLRVALNVSVEGLIAVQKLRNKPTDHYVNRLLKSIHHLHKTASSLAVRRWAAETREVLICQHDPLLCEQLKALRKFIITIKPSQTRRLPKHFAQLDDRQLGRLLSVIAQNDFGFDIERGLLGCFITRGHVFGFRCWRFIHEFRHPSPDKRQAFKHTQGRLFWGHLRVPSAILSELAETKVPGEPFFIGTEEGWRGYLPLMDEVISALSLGSKKTYFYHAEGVTTLQPPQSWYKRQWIRWKLSWQFMDYAPLRNWQENHQNPANSYIHALNKLGIIIDFQGHHQQPGEEFSDPSVLRFFPALLLPDSSLLWENLTDYFVSVYENTIVELAVFMFAVITFFIGKHIYLYRKLKTARNNLPLVLGGWGTRGKSGTERIKSALMNALGYSIISKTSGCEAMFIHAHPFGELREMFLFRPYDKATIWEQHNLVCLADKLQADVFLWECMGLTPSYIRILQRQWMNDDIATITNTYPDHEDLQGPAGINIPEVMTQFIPENSSVITSEEQMRPILETAAYDLNTDFTAVGWLEAGLLAPDVLARFPYDEHPFNIALVLAVAYQLGVEHDFALKEMADRVVADIGVLKTSACAKWRSRRLEFINGMSANERFGCMGNWSRMGLDKLTLEDNPETWITAVINNRSDRIARSRVFASIVVKDIRFDRCVLIGNNLNGFISYIHESWQEWITGISLSTDNQSPMDVLLAMAKRFRVPYSETLVKIRLQKMLEKQIENLNLEVYCGLYQQPDALLSQLETDNVPHYQEIIDFLILDLATLNSYLKFSATLEKAKDQVTDALESAFKNLLWQWFELKLVVIDDYYATGNQIIKQITDVTPPGFYTRIMGMQNIKGTGLDFVYRWQAWDICHKACQQLSSHSVIESDKGLHVLAAFQEYGFLAEETVRETIAKVNDSSTAQNTRYQIELKIILSNLDIALARLTEQKSQQTDANKPWLNKINNFLENLLDGADAIMRRKKADQIYQDMIDQRISHDRAALELQALNKRQKGGWLVWF